MIFFFQAEDGIRDLVRSRGLGDVYKRQLLYQLIGFETIGYENLQVPPGLAGRVLFNPDGVDLSLIHI